jgi:hypothetical protein
MVDTRRPFVLAVPSRDAAASGWAYPLPGGVRIASGAAAITWII